MISNNLIAGNSINRGNLVFSNLYQKWFGTDKSRATSHQPPIPDFSAQVLHRQTELNSLNNLKFHSVFIAWSFVLARRSRSNLSPRFFTSLKNDMNNSINLLSPLEITQFSWCLPEVNIKTGWFQGFLTGLSFAKFVYQKGGDYLQNESYFVTADLISANSVL